MLTTLARLHQTLTESKQAVHLMPLQNGMTALLTQRGARVLGLFPSEDAENLFWTNPALENMESFLQFIRAGGWNLGGERVWIAPEIQYIIRDRTNFWGTHNLPHAIDPGQYQMTAESTLAVFQQEIELMAYNTASGTKQLQMVRVVRPVNNPLETLRGWSSLMDGVIYGGYEQIVTLNQLDTTPMLSEAWNLTQLNPGGQLMIPCTAEVESSDYFGSVPDEARQVQSGNHLRINITGKRQYKIGYKAANMTGRMGYWNTLANGQEYLLVRSFFNNPSNIYAEEPPQMVGETGHSVHVYNDGGELGGFGEMEASGHTIGGRSNRRSAIDTFILWAFVGPGAQIRRIAGTLLGAQPQ